MRSSRSAVDSDAARLAELRAEFGFASPPPLALMEEEEEEEELGGSPPHTTPSSRQSTPASGAGHRPLLRIDLAASPTAFPPSPSHSVVTPGGPSRPGSRLGATTPHARSTRAGSAGAHTHRSAGARTHRGAAPHPRTAAHEAEVAAAAAAAAAELAVPAQELFHDWRAQFPRECVDLAGWQFSDADAARVAHTCPHLVALRVACSEVLTPRGVFELRHCASLQVVGLAWCPRVDDAAITSLARCLPLLRSLDVAGTQVSDAGLRGLAEHCARLRALVISDCARVTDGGLKALAAMGEAARRRSRLAGDAVGAATTHAASRNALALAAQIAAETLRGAGGVPGVATCRADARVLQRMVADIGIAWPQQAGGEGALPGEPPAGVTAEARAQARHWWQRCQEAVWQSGAGRAGDIDTAPGLHWLAMARCNNVTNGGVLALLTQHLHLRRLDLTDCRAVSEVALMVFVTCLAARSQGAADAAALPGPETDSGSSISAGGDGGDSSGVGRGSRAALLERRQMNTPSAPAAYDSLLQLNLSGLQLLTDSAVMWYARASRLPRARALTPRDLAQGGGRVREPHLALSRPLRQRGRHCPARAGAAVRAAAAPLGGGLRARDGRGRCSPVCATRRRGGQPDQP